MFALVRAYLVRGTIQRYCDAVMKVYVRLVCLRVVFKGAQVFQCMNGFKCITEEM